MNRFDVVVIGAGIVGCSTAWRLARTGLRTALIEKGSDIANGATRANSGILHSGIHEDPDSETFKMCREGIQWYRHWAAKLDFEVVNKPTVILANNEQNLQKIHDIRRQHQNTLKPVFYDRQAVRNKWAQLSENIIGAISIEDSAQISPYETCRAILENAAANGLEFFRDCSILQAGHTDRAWQIHTSNGLIQAKAVILAAAAGNHELSACFQLPEVDFKLLSGAYFMFAKSSGTIADSIFFGPAGNDTKGIVIQNTVHGNLMLGPDSIDLKELENDNSKAWHRICNLWHEGLKIFPGLEKRDIIRTFTGNRTCVGSDFGFDNLLKEKGLLRINGIKSPGLTAAPAIAARVCRMLQDILPLEERSSTIDERISINNATSANQAQHIVCRCEQVFAAQIQEAIKRGADSIEAIRWQTRAGMGDCQGSFCRPSLIRIIQQETAVSTEKIKYKNTSDNMFEGDLK